jgi:hypothetical protein
VDNQLYEQYLSGNITTESLITEAGSIEEAGPIKTAVKIAVNSIDDIIRVYMQKRMKAEKDGKVDIAKKYNEYIRKLRKKKADKLKG